MAEKQARTKKSRIGANSVESGFTSRYDLKELQSWLEAEQTMGVPPADGQTKPETQEASLKNRLERIRQSHALLQQFDSKELKILMNLKRNTSPKAWTLREDLVVLTLNLSNREIAEILKDRNKEAVKKRLQLLRSKGLTKRQAGPSA